MCRRYFLFLLALPSFLVPFTPPVEAADAKANELDIKTERVIVFKDGYCLFIKKATATTDKNGEAFTDDVPDSAVCMGEETFAPVAAIVPFETEAEAVERANDSIYGLSAYIFTRDLSRMFRLVEVIEAGMFGVNDGVPTATQAPFGGVKQSGWGRELGIEGMDAFLDTKHVSIGL